MRQLNKSVWGLMLVAFAIWGCKSDDDSTVTPSSATVSMLTCSSATFSATATAGTAYTGTATVPYTGGNGAAYSAGTAISSTGVTGVTAILTAGTLASGAGNVSYTISGTPSGVGTAAFAISFGGQSCSLSLTIGTSGSGRSSDIAAALANTTSTAACNATGVAQIVCLAEAFKATLTSTQLTAAQLSYNSTNAKKWSNLPAAMSARVGINTGSLSTAQLAAFRNLMVGLLALGTENEGYDEMIGNLVADDYLKTIGGGSDYGAGDYYISILGTPSATGLWSILFTGHHYTQPFTFNAGAYTGVTPAFRGTEPQAAVTSGSRTYQAFEQERVAFAAMLTSLSTAEQSTAKLSGTYSDLVLGPGQDGKFPATKSGLQVGSLSSDKQALVVNAIKLYVNDLDATSAAAILAKYTSELSSTYIAFSGNASMSAQNDYVRIDGPGIWIEFSYQGGVIIKGTPHSHSVWRDHNSDYGGN
jgi:hypothetical protein